VHFRPARLSAADVPAGLSCQFRCDGLFVGPLGVLDLSASGFGAAIPATLVLAPGSILESFELLADGSPIWSGEAVVVRGSEDRIGGRFTSGVLDVHHLRLGATLDGRLALLSEQREKLPAEWRAAVADLRQLLEDAKVEMDELEQSESRDPLRAGEEEMELFARVRARWGTVYYRTVEQLHAMSRSLDRHAAELGRSYATSMLMPLLAACPLQRRAYDKPLGYAGDYRMMELCAAHELDGVGLYGRFLHSVGQDYTLVRAVRERERVIRKAVRQALDVPSDEPLRVLALAAGPVIELRRLLEETETLARPVEFILVDQEPSAHENAHRQLTRILLERHRGLLPVTLRCLHFSVRQMIRPQTLEESRVIEEVLSNVDLAYSAGLYDYLPERVAAALTRRVFGCLRPGGRMLLGNLMETPDSTWVMEYVLDWPLIYRDADAMLRLGANLPLAPGSAQVTYDTTGRCVFLDVTKPPQA
jgi:hypothetical protein